ncbi:MAG: hypothetical protein R2910_00070 [Gemmatimonadales bacterium]
MRLGLSSEAAPDAPLNDLILFAQRRGLAALELREGDAHGVAPDTSAPGAVMAAELVRTAGLTLTGYRTHQLEDERRLARLSEALDAPVLLAGPVPLAVRVARAERIRQDGGQVAILLRGESAVWDGIVCHAAGVALAWEADPQFGPLGAMAEPLLERFGNALGHIRLIGGGPETASQDGAGVGDLMRRLALASYSGTVTLTPSAPRYGVAWQHWLGRRGGWGCGSSGTASSPVPLRGPLTTGARE